MVIKIYYERFFEKTMNFSMLYVTTFINENENLKIIYVYYVIYRHGAIQTRGQMEVIREFEQYLKPFRIIFSIAYVTGFCIWYKTFFTWQMYPADPEIKKNEMTKMFYQQCFLWLLKERNLRMKGKTKQPQE